MRVLKLLVVVTLVFAFNRFDSDLLVTAQDGPLIATTPKEDATTAKAVLKADAETSFETLEIPVHLKVHTPAKFKEETVVVEGLVQGVPTSIDIHLPPGKFEDASQFVISKSCACFSAKFVSSDETLSNRQDGGEVIRVIAIPKESRFSEEVHIFHRDDSIDDGSGDGPKYDMASVVCSIKLIGKAVAPVKIELSKTTLPRPGEDRELTVRPTSALIRLVPDSVRVRSELLDAEVASSNDNDSIRYLCKRKSEESRKNIEHGGSESSLVIVECRYMVGESMVELHLRETIQMWSSAVIRILPTQILISEEDVRSGIKLTIDETSAQDNVEDFPYKMRFLSGGSQDVIAEANILKSEKLTSGRWAVTIEIPKEIDSTRLSLLDILYKDDDPKTPSRSKIVVYGRG